MSVAKSPRRRRSRSRKAVPPQKHELVQQLTRVALRLEGVRATCVTVQVALEEQAADYDVDFACCLGRNVSDPISELIEGIGELVVRLGGRCRSS